MEIAGIAIAVVLGLGAIYVGYLAWRDRRGRIRLEYVVTTTTELVPAGWGDALQVVHDGQDVNDPWLVITRIVHTGDKALEVSAFETPLRLTFAGSLGVASVNLTGQRPKDLKPGLERDADSVLIDPTLINPGDMIELQVLTTGQPEKVELTGRISEGKFRQLLRLPYPPGSGPEGEMLGFDKFMTIILPACFFVGVAVAFALNKESSLAVRIAVPIGALFIGVAYGSRERWLVKRRAMFKPARVVGTPRSPRTAA